MNEIQKASAIYFGVLVIFFIPIFYILDLEEFNYFEKWDEEKGIYFERLLLLGQGTIGLIIIISILYLGKFHDYQKDMIKLEVELDESVEKFQKKFPKRSWMINNEIYDISRNTWKQLIGNQKILRIFPKVQIFFMVGQIIIVVV